MSIRDKKASTRKLGDRRSPIENVELFTYSVGLSQENNFMDNAEKLAKYVWANIGNIGNVIDKKEYPVIARRIYEKDTPQTAGMSEAEIQALQITTNTSWIRALDKLEEQKPKLYGLLLQLLTEEGEDKVKSMGNWPKVEETRDPLLLWELIVWTHQLKADDISPEELKYTARVRYQKCWQGAEETLRHYFRRRKECLSVLLAVGEPKVDKSQQSMDFLEGLHRGHFGDMLTDLKFRVRTRQASFPTTMEEAYDYAANYWDTTRKRVTFRREVEPASAPVTVYAADATTQKSLCEGCGRYHYGECWGPKGKNKRTTGNSNNNAIMPNAVESCNKKTINFASSLDKEDGEDVYIPGVPQL